MSHKPARYGHPGAHQLLNRILEQPALVATVQALEPRLLARLIQHVGLEDSGELVALATTEQLERVFDEDLWKSERPGKDETFDADRFALWLEVMLEAGEGFVARKLTELPEELVTLALYQHILVIDIDELAVRMSYRAQGDDLIEKALESCLYHEFGEYRVISKRHEGWDAILNVLATLYQHHYEFLQRIFIRICALSTEYIEENGGLHHVLTSSESLEADVAADREDRRAREGFISPSGAASFLSLGRTVDPATAMASAGSDAVTRAYFREYQPAEVKDAPHRQAPEATPLVELLHKAEVLEEVRPLLPAAAGTAQHSEACVPFRRALAELAERDAQLHGRRMVELSYLANVLLAGCSFNDRSFRAREAVEAVVAVCNLGLEHVLAATPGVPRRAVGLLERESADRLFRVGWYLLHHDVALAAARALARVLSRRSEEAAERHQAAQLARGARAAHAAVETGKPWHLRHKLAGLVEEPDHTVLRALLAECPVLAPPLGDVGEQAGIEFIGTTKQLHRAQRYIEKL